MQARNRGELEGQGKQSKMVCKENKANWERETKDKKTWEGRERGWKEGKTGAEMEKHRGLGRGGEGNFLAPQGFLITSFSFQEA